MVVSLEIVSGIAPRDDLEIGLGVSSESAGVPSRSPLGDPSKNSYGVSSEIRLRVPAWNTWECCLYFSTLSCIFLLQ